MHFIVIFNWKAHEFVLKTVNKNATSRYITLQYHEHVRLNQTSSWHWISARYVQESWVKRMYERLQVAGKRRTRLLILAYWDHVAISPDNKELRPPSSTIFMRLWIICNTLYSHAAYTSRRKFYSNWCLSLFTTQLYGPFIKLIPLSINNSWGWTSHKRCIHYIQLTQFKFSITSTEWQQDQKKVQGGIAAKFIYRQSLAKEWLNTNYESQYLMTFYCEH